MLWLAVFVLKLVVDFSCQQDGVYQLGPGAPRLPFEMALF